MQAKCHPALNDKKQLDLLLAAGRMPLRAKNGALRVVRKF